MPASSCICAIPLAGPGLIDTNGGTMMIQPISTARRDSSGFTSMFSSKSRASRLIL